MRNGANFGKVKTDEKIEKSGAVGEVSSCSSYNSHQEYVSPEGAFELRNKGEKPFFKNSALVGSSRDNKNIDNQFRGSIAIYNDGKEMENRKLHHGYSRSWFGNQSVKPETHLPCSSGRSHAKQSISNHGGIQKRMSQKKKNKTSTPGRITLLKKNGSEDEVDLVLPAVTETEKPKKSGRSENQNQETTTFRESNPVEELTQQLSKQRLRSPKNSACSSSTTVIVLMVHDVRILRCVLFLGFISLIDIKSFLDARNNRILESYFFNLVHSEMLAEQKG